MWRIVSVSTFLAFVAPSYAQQVYVNPDGSLINPGVYVSVGGGNGYDIPAETQALNNARAMIALFSTARAVDSAGIFLNAQTQFHNTFVSALELAVRFKLLQKGFDQARLQPVINALETAVSVENFLNDFLMYQRATTPDAIVAFYGQSDAKYFLPRAFAQQAPEWYWVVNEGADAPLAFWVSLRTAGPFDVPTPMHIAKLMTASIEERLPVKVPELGEFIQEGIRGAIVDGFQVASGYLNSVGILNYGFRVDQTWLESNADTAQMGNQRIEQQILVGDTRVVNIPVWDRAHLNPHPGYANGQNPNQWYVRGVKVGMGTLVGEFSGAFVNLGKLSTERMAFCVLGPNRKCESGPNQNSSPNLQPAMPVWSGPPIAPRLPAPVLYPQPARPAPLLPPQPQRPAPVLAKPQPVPPQPAWSLCGPNNIGTHSSQNPSDCQLGK